MLIESLSVPAQGATELAGRLAVKHNHRHLGPVHLLSALLSAKDSPSERYLASAGCDVARLRELLERRLREVPKAEAGAQQTPISRGLEAVFIRAEEAVAKLENKYISPNHLLLGMLGDDEISADFAGSNVDRDALDGQSKDWLLQRAVELAFEESMLRALARGEGAPRPAAATGQHAPSTGRPVAAAASNRYASAHSLPARLK
jgi:ATP-dependent Clp protease ATP-binding subunit ClpA